MKTILLSAAGDSFLLSVICLYCGIVALSSGSSVAGVVILLASYFNFSNGVKRYQLYKSVPEEKHDSN